jgi:protein tyrosine/serine phosphatase
MQITRFFVSGPFMQAMLPEQKTRGCSQINYFAGINGTIKKEWQAYPVYIHCNGSRGIPGFSAEQKF